MKTTFTALCGQAAMLLVPVAPALGPLAADIAALPSYTLDKIPENRSRRARRYKPRCFFRGVAL